MSTNKPTHSDVIEYIEDTIDNRSHYELLNGSYGEELVIDRWVQFNNFKFSTLPKRMVFDSVCDLDNSRITTVPEDIVLNSRISLVNTKILTLPVLDINGYFNIAGTVLVIADGTYINGILVSGSSRYEHLTYVLIGGYFFSTGILS